MFELRVETVPSEKHQENHLVASVKGGSWGRKALRKTMMLSKVPSFPKGKTAFSNIFLYSNKRALIFEFLFFLQKVSRVL